MENKCFQNQFARISFDMDPDTKNKELEFEIQNYKQLEYVLIQVISK